MVSRRIIASEDNPTLLRAESNSLYRHRRMPLDPKQRHKLLMADRTRDAAWITAAIEHLVAADSTVTLDEIEGALRDAAGAAYVVAGERFEVVIGMPAMLAAVAAFGMTPLENRVALAGKPAVAGAAALLHQNVGGPAY